MFSLREKALVYAAAHVAKRLHAGQMDKGGNDYFTAHLTKVGLSGTTWKEMVVGFLHDAAEDTGHPVEEVLGLVKARLEDIEAGRAEDWQNEFNFPIAPAAGGDDALDSHCQTAPAAGGDDALDSHCQTAPPAECHNAPAECCQTARSIASDAASSEQAAMKCCKQSEQAATKCCKHSGEAALNETIPTEEDWKEIAEALARLNHFTIPEREAYIERFRGDALAIKVKLNDMANNMDISRIPSPTQRDLDRLERYKKEFEILKGMLADTQKS